MPELPPAAIAGAAEVELEAEDEGAAEAEAVAGPGVTEGAGLAGAWPEETLLVEDPGFTAVEDPAAGEDGAVVVVEGDGGASCWAEGESRALVVAAGSPVVIAVEAAEPYAVESDDGTAGVEVAPRFDCPIRADEETGRGRDRLGFPNGTAAVPVLFEPIPRPSSRRRSLSVAVALAVVDRTAEMTPVPRLPETGPVGPGSLGASVFVVGISVDLRRPGSRTFPVVGVPPRSPLVS